MQTQEFDLGDMEIDFDNVEVETLDVKQHLRAPEMIELQTINASLQEELSTMKQTIEELKQRTIKSHETSLDDRC